MFSLFVAISAAKGGALVGRLQVDKGVEKSIDVIQLGKVCSKLPLNRRLRDAFAELDADVFK